jgi:hypothetical protein
LADFLNSSPLKPLGQMIWNLVGSIYGRSSIKSNHFVPIPLTNMAVTGACLVTDSDKWAIFIRGLSIDASYQISDHLAMRFQRRCLEIDQSETRIACGGNKHGHHRQFFFLIDQFLKNLLLWHRLAK